MIIQRLRWVALVIIAFSIVITLAGQPSTFWHDPSTAMRGDGLPIHDSTNHSFEFFLGSGWLPFLAACFAYSAILFWLISALPRGIALVIAFTTILSHFYFAGNWLAVHWSMAGLGPLLISVPLSVAIFLSAFDGTPGRKPLNGLRVVMLLSMTVDAVFTVIGQPSGFWHIPSLVHEANPVSRLFLQHGWYSYIPEQMAIMVIFYRLIGALSRPWGLTIAWCWILGAFAGATNWMFFEWRWGLPAVVSFASLLSIIVMLSSFPERADSVS